MRITDLTKDIKGTVKGLDLKAGDVVDFYGMGKDTPCGYPTRCVLTKVGAGYMLSSLTGEPITWEFGTSARVYAIKATEPTIAERDLNGTTVYTATCACLTQWTTGFHVTAEDAAAVAMGHGQVSRPLYKAPEPVEPVLADWEAELAARPVTTILDAPMKLTVIADDEPILAATPVSAYTALNPAPYAAHKGHRLNLSGTHRGNRVCLDCGVIPVGEPGRDSPCALCGRNTVGRDDQVTPFPHECATAEELAQALNREVDTPLDTVLTLSDAQERAMIVVAQAPNGLTESDWRQAGITKRTMDVLVRTRMVNRANYTNRGQVYTLGEDGMAWAQAHVTMSAEQAAITYPTPTAQDVATMTGEPVGWVNDLLDFVTPTNTPTIAGYRWARHTQPGQGVSATSTYQLIVEGKVCEVSATVRYVRDGLWLAQGCAFMVTGLTRGYTGEPLADAFAKVVRYMEFVASVIGRFTWAEIVRMDWQRGPVPVVTEGDWVYRDADGHQGMVTWVGRDMIHVEWVGGGLSQLDLGALVSMGFEVITASEYALGCEWARGPVASPITAGSDTMTVPMRTKVNRRKRKASRRRPGHAFASRR